jgi:hypothetical protein
VRDYKTVLLMLFVRLLNLASCGKNADCKCLKIKCSEKIFAHKKDENKFAGEYFRSNFVIYSVVGMVKCTRLRWDGHVANWGYKGRIQNLGQQTSWETSTWKTKKEMIALR